MTQQDLSLQPTFIPGHFTQRYTPASCKIRQFSDERCLDNYEQTQKKWNETMITNERYMKSRNFNQKKDISSKTEHQNILTSNEDWELKRQMVEALEEATSTERKVLPQQMWYDSLRNNPDPGLQSRNEYNGIDSDKRLYYKRVESNRTNSDLYALIKNCDLNKPKLTRPIFSRPVLFTDPQLPESTKSACSRKSLTPNKYMRPSYFEKKVGKNSDRLKLILGCNKIEDLKGIKIEGQS